MQSLFCEDLDSELEEIVHAEEAEVWQEARKEGRWGPGDCGIVADIWAQVFLRRTRRRLTIISGQYLGHLDTNDREDIIAGRLSPPLSSDHVWLEINGVLFDPTASQFRPRSGLWQREDYLEDQRQDLR